MGFWAPHRNYLEALRRGHGRLEGCRQRSCSDLLRWATAHLLRVDQGDALRASHRRSHRVLAPPLMRVLALLPRRAAKVGARLTVERSSPAYALGMDLCPGCGDENQPVGNFCPECGVALLDYGATPHEDDPERAARAAVGIRGCVAGHEVGQQLRMTVITGEAPVALGFRPNQGEGMAWGDVVNTAALWQRGVPVSDLPLGETTYRSTALAIAYRDAEPIAAKGKASAAGPACTTRCGHS